MRVDHVFQAGPETVQWGHVLMRAPFFGVMSNAPLPERGTVSAIACDLAVTQLVNRHKAFMPCCRKPHCGPMSEAACVLAK